MGKKRDRCVEFQNLLFITLLLRNLVQQPIVPGPRPVVTSASFIITNPIFPGETEIILRNGTVDMPIDPEDIMQLIIAYSGSIFITTFPNGTTLFSFPGPATFNATILQARQNGEILHVDWTGTIISEEGAEIFVTSETQSGIFVASLAIFKGFVHGMLTAR
jgi:hypothetical protein